MSAQSDALYEQSVANGLAIAADHLFEQYHLERADQRDIGNAIAALLIAIKDRQDRVADAIEKMEDAA